MTLEEIWLEYIAVGEELTQLQARSARLEKAVRLRLRELQGTRKPMVLESAGIIKVIRTVRREQLKSPGTPIQVVTDYSTLDGELLASTTKWGA